MSDVPGMRKPDLLALPQVKDRMSFLYLERCLINRQDGAITITDARGTVHVPAASLSVLLLGPGTNVSHRAMELIGHTGVRVIWVGEQGVRYYAHGHPLTHSARLLIRQAELVSNVRKRVAVARQMYQMRFPDEDVSSLTMQQLRGREGARIRSMYRQASKDTGVPWGGREYDPNDFNASDPVNMALSAAHACLYGVVHSIIVALGCSPGLGFIHTGHERSFVYDIADLYKGNITIPIAFEVASKQPEDIGSVTRHRVRNAIAGGSLLKQCAKDIRFLLLEETAIEEDMELAVLHLWDDKKGLVSSAVSYGKKRNRRKWRRGRSRNRTGRGKVGKGLRNNSGGRNMIVITLTACPPALRGDLTKWLQEINTGVYVGQVSARVRDELWKRIKEKAKDGRATMVFSAQNEQRLDFRVHNTSWEPIDFDGLKLMLRPGPARVQQLSEMRVGFSNASRMRKAKQMAKKV